MTEYSYLGDDFCPYCIFYNRKCKDCPMYKADNFCSQDEDSTWGVAADLWEEKSTEKDWKKLRNLVVEYSKQFENSKIN